MLVLIFMGHGRVLLRLWFQVDLGDFRMSWNAGHLVISNLINFILMRISSCSLSIQKLSLRICFTNEVSLFPKLVWTFWDYFSWFSCAGLSINRVSLLSCLRNDLWIIKGVLKVQLLSSIFKILLFAGNLLIRPAHFWCWRRRSLCWLHLFLRSDLRWSFCN